VAKRVQRNTMLLKCAVFSDNQLGKHQRKVSQK